MNIFDARKRSYVKNFVITDEILNASILSYLAYLDPDIFYMKWNIYKNKEIEKVNSNNFYSIREYYASKMFFNIKIDPLFYDGSTNEKVLRDAQAYLVTKDNTQYIVFRGSSSIFDFISDFDFLQIPLDGYPLEDNIRVHRGFYMQFKSVRDKLFADIDPSKKLVFCGHSLAASCATLSALYYGAIHKESDITCITFGSPRIGNSGFVNLYNKIVKNTLRFTTEKDIVPVMSLPIYEYNHVCDAYCLKENYVLKEEGDTHWIYRIFCSILKITKPLYMHSYNTYINYILKLYLKI
jgi:predicted lipase